MWPNLRWHEITSLVLLVIGAAVAGIVLADPIQEAVSTLNPVSMVIAGWASIGVPLIACWAIYVFGNPSRRHIWIMIAMVALLAVSVAVTATATDSGRGDAGRARTLALVIDALKGISGAPAVAPFYFGVISGLGGLVAAGLVLRAAKPLVQDNPPWYLGIGGGAQMVALVAGFWMAA